MFKAKFFKDLWKGANRKKIPSSTHFFYNCLKTSVLSGKVAKMLADIWQMWKIHCDFVAITTLLGFVFATSFQSICHTIGSVTSTDFLGPPYLENSNFREKIFHSGGSGGIEKQKIEQSSELKGSITSYCSKAAAYIKYTRQRRVIWPRLKPGIENDSPKGHVTHPRSKSLSALQKIKWPTESTIESARWPTNINF